MISNKEAFKRRLATADKQLPADLVIKNGRIVDVFNLEIIEGDLAISDGVIVGIGEFDGDEIIDAKNRFICPSFIDGHVHIESSMVTPAEFAKVVLPHGVTTVITDPHEIANVSGAEGIQFMLENSKRIPLEVFFMLPSCVPATPFENSGAELKANDLEPFYKNKRVLGLAEVMDFPSLKDGKDTLIDKLMMTARHRDHVDGHLAGLTPDAVNLYRSAGISTDHESHTAEEAKERLKRGMYLLIREGSAAKDLKTLIEIVTPHNARRCLFCTDDKHLDELMEEGSIDHNVRLAVQSGLDPLMAIQMGSLNAAECYGLKTKGAIAPGFDADFLIVEDLDELTIKEVYKKGVCVARDGDFIGNLPAAPSPTEKLTQTIHIPKFTVSDLQIPISHDRRAYVIKIIPNQIVTRSSIESVDVKNGVFQPSSERDQLKLIAAERHKATGQIGVGIVKGFGILNGTLAATVAHDSHNIVAAGTSDTDLLLAIEVLKDLAGGLVIIKDGQVVASLSLSIAGLMSIKNAYSVKKQLDALNYGLSEIGFKGNFNPFLTLSFLTLPVIPALKLTDLGLFDVAQGCHIPVSL